jgi:hypothetical protein
MKKLLLITAILLTGCATSVPVKQNFPDAPKELLEKCPELKQTEQTTKLSEVLKVVTENYSQYQECKLEVYTWIEWYSTQKQIFESVK